jgi:diadenosine tetraphosphate (Ap4A) HIT family hydrolase
MQVRAVDAKAGDSVPVQSSERPVMNEIPELKSTSELKCPLCPPRDFVSEDRYEIASFSTSTLYLYGDQRFLGYSVLVFDGRHASGLHELTKDECTRYLDDLRLGSNAIHRALSPDHMNIELLGNAVPHLHWHIIPRYTNDPRWGQVVWVDWPPNEFNQNRLKLSQDKATQLVAKIRQSIER